MRNKLVIGLIAMGMLLIGPVGQLWAGALPPGYSWTFNEGHWYALTQNYGDWDACKAEAEAVGGYLAVINDEAENIYLTNLEFIKNAGLSGTPGPFTEPTDKNLVWIGYRLFEGDWDWYTGDPVTYTNYYELWDDYSGTHAYLHGGNHPRQETWNHANWHDDDTAQQPFGIIEIIPEPATLSLLAIGGLALLRRKR